MGLSVNRTAIRIVNKLIDNQTELNLKVEKTDEGTTIIDAGIDVKGGYAAGKYLTEACLGGLGKANINMISIQELQLPAITVTTDFPTISLFGSQFAGWRISVGKYFAMGSGPARALALKPKEMYTNINYRDESDTATIILETSAKPTKEVIEYISKECKVNPDKLNIIIAPTSSIAGSTQISGRIVETGLHKLTDVGLDSKIVLSGMGIAPIATIHPKFDKAMGRTNDMILYGGSVFFNVAYENDDELKGFVERTPSSCSKDYGKPFAEIFKAAKNDFYLIDAGLFAPATITVNNVKTGKSFTAGQINVDILRKSINS